MHWLALICSTSSLYELALVASASSNTGAENCWRHNLFLCLSRCFSFCVFPAASLSAAISFARLLTPRVDANTHVLCLRSFYFVGRRQVCRLAVIAGAALAST